MLVVRMAKSNPSRLSERELHLESHKAYLRSCNLTIVLSGPVADEEGQSMGAMVLLDVDDMQDVFRFSEGDPFVIHGVYDHVKIYRWNATIDNR